MQETEFPMVIRQDKKKGNLESHGSRLHSPPPYAISYNHVVPEVQESHKTVAAMSDDSDVDAPDCIVAVGVSFCLLLSVFVKQSGRKGLKSFYKL